eukprot:332483-Hanusia_phi.AAC.1
MFVTHHVTFVTVFRLFLNQRSKKVVGGGMQPGEVFIILCVSLLSCWQEKTRRLDGKIES